MLLLISHRSPFAYSRSVYKLERGVNHFVMLLFTIFSCSSPAADGSLCQKNSEEFFLLSFFNFFPLPDSYSVRVILIDVSLLCILCCSTLRVTMIDDFYLHLNYASIKEIRSYGKCSDTNYLDRNSGYFAAVKLSGTCSLTDADRSCVFNSGVFYCDALVFLEDGTYSFDFMAFDIFSWQYENERDSSIYFQEKNEIQQLVLNLSFLTDYLNFTFSETFKPLDEWEGGFGTLYSLSISQLNDL